MEVLIVVWRDVHSGHGVFFQICNRTNSDLFKYTYISHVLNRKKAIGHFKVLCSL